MNTVFSGALLYIVPTFILAFFWHLKWFERLYERWDYAGSKPNIPLGFLSIVLQGAILSLLYAMAPIEHDSLASAAPLMALFACFLWTTHVLAAMAKNKKLRNWGFLTLESVYLCLQFGIFSVLLTVLVY